MKKTISQPRAANLFTLIFALSVGLLSSLLSAVMCPYFEDYGMLSVCYSAVLYTLVYLPFVLGYYFFAGKKRKSIGLSLPEPMLVFICVPLAFLVQPILMFLSSLTSVFFTNYIDESMYAIYQQPLWQLIITQAFLPAVYEEILCRGIIFSAYRKKGRPISGIWISALFFASMHGNFQQLPYAFVSGLLFGFIAYYSGSALPSMVMHFLINGTQVIYSRYVFLNEATVNAFFDGLGSAYLPLILAVILVTLPLILLLLKSIRDNSRYVPLAETKNATPLENKEMWPMYLALFYGLCECVLYEFVLI